MPEVGDYDIMGGPAPQEQSEKSDEKFREEQRRTQKAIRDLQKEEGKSRKQDQNLAQILIAFLSEPQNADLFLLISRVVSQNIPSELILAIISLIDERANKEVQGYLESGEKEPTNTKALAVPDQNTFESLPPEHKSRIDQWVKTIYAVGLKKPHRILETVLLRKRSDDPLDPNVIKEISPTLIQLSTFILRNYLKKNNIQFEFEQLHGFMQNIFLVFIQIIEKQVKDQKQLKQD